MNNNRIFYTKPSITELEIRYATDTPTNGWEDRCYEYITSFEEAFWQHLEILEKKKTFPLCSDIVTRRGVTIITMIICLTMKTACIIFKSDVFAPRWISLWASGGVIFIVKLQFRKRSGIGKLNNLAAEGSETPIPQAQRNW